MNIKLYDIENLEKIILKIQLSSEILQQILTEIQICAQINQVNFFFLILIKNYFSIIIILKIFQ